MDILQIVVGLLIIVWCLFYIAGLVKFVVTKKSFGKFWAWSSVGFCVLMATLQIDAGFHKSPWHFAIALAWGLNIYLLIRRDAYWNSPA